MQRAVDIAKPELFKACGPFVDVVSMNYYRTWTPDAGSVPESVTASGNVETVTFTLSNGPIFGKLFVRVEATQP